MTHHIDLDALEPRERYKLLCATVIPRPVAWVTTVDAEGVVNAAPFSFFNVFGQDPALIVLGLEHRAGAVPKDTTRNIRRSGEFVVNIATPDLLEAMVGTASAYAGSEVEALGLATEPSVAVAPPRLSAAPVSIECRRLTTLAFSDERDLVIGQAVAMAARDGLIDPATNYIDWRGHYPVARLFADRYASLDDLAPMSISPVPQGDPS
jgi:flavin reductase (DIM6/NTAB) family NADH-FMN oxidoreductase RutF